MNEGENSSMPNNPNFSSPNIASNDASMPLGTEVEPTQQAITSSDISAMAGTDAGAVAAAAAALPDNDAPTAVNSGVISSSPEPAAPQRSRFNFGSRRFHGANSQSQQQTSTLFSNAPDYFSQAAGDIQIDNGVKSDNKKKFIIGGIIAAVVAVVILAIVLLPKGTVAERAVKLRDLAKEYSSDVNLFEDSFEHAAKDGFRLNGNRVTEDQYNSNKDKYTTSYNRVKEFRQKLNNYSDLDVADNGTSNNLKEQVEKLKSALDGRMATYEAYSKIIPALYYAYYTEASDEAIKELEASYNSENMKKVGELIKNYYSKRAEYDKTYISKGCNKNAGALECKTIAVSITKLSYNLKKDKTLSTLMKSFVTEDIKREQPMKYINVISNSNVGGKKDEEK